MLRVIADHGLSHQYACWYRLQPMAVQTYSAAIAAVGSIAAAKWFSWLALAALVLLVAEEVQRRSGSRRLGLFAGAAVLSCPVLAGLSGSLYVDHVMALLCTAGFVVLVPRGAVLPGRGAAQIGLSLARHPAFGGDHGLDGPGEVHRLDLRRGLGPFPGGRSAAEVRLASCLAMVGRGRRAAGGGRLALVRLRVSGHGKSLLSLLEPLVPVALLGRRLHAPAGFRGELQAAARRRRRGGVSLDRHLPYRRFRGRIRRTLGFWARLGAVLFSRGWRAEKGTSAFRRRRGVSRNAMSPARTGTWRLSASR